MDNQYTQPFRPDNSIPPQPPQPDHRPAMPAPEPQVSQARSPKQKSSVKTLLSTMAVIILIAAAGYGGYKYEHSKASTVEVSQSSQITSLQKQESDLDNEIKADKAAVTTSKTATPTYTATDALGQVQSAYNTVLAYEKSKTGVSQAEINTVKADLTTALYTQLSTAVKTPSSDPLLCSQSLPSSLSASAGATTNGVSTVYVNEVFGSTTDKVTTTVDLSNLDIASITCPS